MKYRVAFQVDGVAVSTLIIRAEDENRAITAARRQLERNGLTVGELIYVQRLKEGAR